MGIDTDASELSRRRIDELRRLDDEYNKRYYPAKANIFNGSTKIVTWLMALLNVLVAAGIVGGIMMYGRVGALEVGVQDLKDKIGLVIEGRIRIPHD